MLMFEDETSADATETRGVGQIAEWTKQDSVSQ